MLPVDIYESSHDDVSLYMHIKEDMNDKPITDIVISNGSNIDNISKWTKLDVNLNKAEDSLYLYYTKDTSISKNPVTSVLIKKRSDTTSPEYKRMPIQYSHSLLTSDLYLYYSQMGPQDPITHITAKKCLIENCYMEGWERVEKNLNKGVIGMSVYLFIRRDPTANPVIDVVAIINNQTPPHGYTKVDVDLNSLTFGGDNIYLYYKIASTSKEDKAITEMAIQFGVDTIVPYGWEKLDVDLNSESDGNTFIGESIHLMFKRGYTELPKQPRLMFNQEGEFKILQLADLHYTNQKGVCLDVLPEMNCQGDIDTIEFVEKLLDREKPDLVVFTGDNIHGELVTDSRAALFKMADSVIKREIPWATVFGNHDDKGDLNREELLEVMRRMPFSLMEHGPISLPGIGNYFLKILSNGTMAATHDFTLYFLDSHSNNVDNPEEYDPITGDQLDWVVRSANTFKKLPTSPNAAVFFHIPIWEYNTNNNDNYVLGDQRESVTSPPKNDVRSALESFKQAGNIRMTVCGHDHVNDYCTTNGGITLCYGGGAGVGGYGASHLGWPRRSRIYNILDHGHKIQTWKRLHNARLELKHFQTLYES